MLVGNSKCWSNSTGLSLNFGGDDIRIIQGFVLSHILTDKAILGQAPSKLGNSLHIGLPHVRTDIFQLFTPLRTKECEETANGGFGALLTNPQ